MKKMFLAIFKEFERSYVIAGLLTILLFVVCTYTNIIPAFVFRLWEKYIFLFPNTVVTTVTAVGVYFYIFLINVRRIQFNSDRSGHIDSEEFYPYITMSVGVGMATLVGILTGETDSKYIYIYLFANLIPIMMYAKTYRFVQRHSSENKWMGILRGKRVLVCGSLLAGFPLLLLNIESGIFLSSMIYFFIWSSYYAPVD